MWISIQEPRLTHSQKETNHCLTCKSYQAVVCLFICFHFTLPMGFSFVCHLLSSSLPLTTIMLQQKMKNPGRPPRCHIPPPFLIHHLSYTNRFQCLIRTIHFPPMTRDAKNTVSKPPFLYQLWIFIEFRTLINSPWVQAGNSVDWVKAFRAMKTALSCSLSLSRLFSVWVP